MGERMKMSPSMSRESFNGQGVNNGTGNSTHQYNEYQVNKGFEYKEHSNRHTENAGWCRSLMITFSTAPCDGRKWNFPPVYLYRRKFGSTIDRKSLACLAA